MYLNQVSINSLRKWVVQKTGSWEGDGGLPPENGLKTNSLIPINKNNHGAALWAYHLIALPLNMDGRGDNSRMTWAKAHISLDFNFLCWNIVGLEQMESSLALQNKILNPVTTLYHLIFNFAFLEN